jgi:hypothetical protein
MGLSQSEGMMRRLMYVLPMFMGGIEYMVRVGFTLAGTADFFPISLMASSVSMNVALILLPASRSEMSARWKWQPSRAAILIANLGVFASLGGMLLWLYMLLASFNDAVKAIVPVQPMRDSLFYYFFSIVLSEWKAWVMR